MAGRISVAVEVVGVGSDGTTPSIVFAVYRHGVYSTDKTLLKRYLFNCGEGTQRLCGENGIKLNSLDALFLTRLSIETASGIPGLVFALGGLGAADLRIHGPRGTLQRLTAMRSFVRRKHPAIDCITIQDEETAEANAGDITHRTWMDGTSIEDPFSRIVAVSLGTRNRREPPRCWICAKCSPLTTSSARPPVVAPQTDGDHEDDPDRAWLIRFYQSKGLLDKLPHVDVILRRYAGRVDELKQQLTTKYRSADSSDTSPSSSSSSDDDSSSEEEQGEAEQPFTWSGPVNVQWLEALYRRFDPSKASRVSQILRQFAGREEKLRAMLLSKYSVEETQATDSPPAKRLKITTETLADDAHTDIQEQTEIPVVFASQTSDTAPAVASEGPDANATCYVIQFRAPPAPVVWVIDCPTVDKIDSLEAQLRGVHCGHTPVLIVHLSPPSIVQHERYNSWVASLAHDSQGHDVEHLVFDGQALQNACDGVFSFAFQSSARHFLRNQEGNVSTLPHRWQGLHRVVAECESSSAPVQAKILSHLTARGAHVAQPKLSFSISDTASVDYTQVGWKPRPPKDEDDTTVDGDGHQVRKPPVPTLQSKQTLSVLGTGSAAPSKLRASTSLYLSLGDDDSCRGLLIDCGEGTYGQLERQFASPADLAARIAGLQLIWISHHHADHQCGLLRVVSTYLRVTDSTDSKLFIVAPASVLDYMAAWLPSPPPRIHSATCVAMNDRSSAVRMAFDSCLKGLIDDIYSLKVWHCYDAFGLVLRLADGTKLVYSGDTKPCDQLVRAGYDASILIHEATFDDSMAEDADKKKHSTVGQALEVARRMRAKRLVLTHFSQRYPSLPPALSASASDCVMEIITAFDGITVSL